MLLLDQPHKLWIQLDGIDLTGLVVGGLEHICPTTGA
jgi:hypothetical protein